MKGSLLRLSAVRRQLGGPGGNLSCMELLPLAVLASLLHASFSPRLAASVISPLRFANPSPPSGWVEDLHLQAVEHARHTKKIGGSFEPPIRNEPISN
jgi:hypothetical protein